MSSGQARARPTSGVTVHCVGQGPFRSQWQAARRRTSRGACNGGVLVCSHVSLWIVQCVRTLRGPLAGNARGSSERGDVEVARRAGSAGKLQSKDADQPQRSTSQAGQVRCPSSTHEPHKCRQLLAPGRLRNEYCLVRTLLRRRSFRPQPSQPSR